MPKDFDAHSGKKVWNSLKRAKPVAIMLVCPGIINDGLFGHSMRDACWSCAPFWEQYPVCPVHTTKLSQSLYCRACRKHYAKPAQLDLRKAIEQLGKHV